MTDSDTILIDSNYLGHRARYTMKGLSHGAKGTGVIFGYLSQILHLSEMFKTNDLVLCWDSRKSIRKIGYPWYKKRKELTDEEREDLQDALRQFDLLREEILPEIGFENILMSTGYESDDLFGEIIKTWPGSFVIVSADEDLFQLLHGCRCYNPNKNKMMTSSRLFSEYGIKPKQWVMVKAIGGCSSDTVPGIPGVGEKTAIKYLKGELKPASKAFQSIEAGKDVIARNLKVVSLPLAGVELQDKIPNRYSMPGFLNVCSKYGMDSFLEEDMLLRWETLFSGESDPVRNKMKKRRGLGLARKDEE